MAVFHLKVFIVWYRYDRASQDFLFNILKWSFIKPQIHCPGTWSFIRTFVTAFQCLHATSTVCLSILGDGSLLWGFFHLFKIFYSSISFSSLESRVYRQRMFTVHCTDCKAHWGDMMVILVYIFKIDLISICFSFVWMTEWMHGSIYLIISWGFFC